MAHLEYDDLLQLDALNKEGRLDASSPYLAPAEEGGDKTVLEWCLSGEGVVSLQCFSNRAQYERDVCSEDDCCAASCVPFANSVNDWGTTDCVALPDESDPLYPMPGPFCSASVQVPPPFWKSHAMQPDLDCAVWF